MTATSEQRRVEELFSESAHDYEEKRQQHARQWLDYHERQVRALEATLGCIVHEHLREQDRYRQLLNGTTEGAEQHD